MSDIGKLSENHVLEVLWRSIECARLPPWITGPFAITPQNSLDDKKGIDIWVGTIEGRVPIQIKTTRVGGARRYRDRGIGYVVVKTSKAQKIRNDEKLIPILIREIGFAFRHKRFERMKDDGHAT
jgi:hypothetical protein